MLQKNYVKFQGYLSKDVETFGDGKVAKTSIAVNNSYKNKSGEWVDDANFFELVGFGKQAELWARHLKKGDFVEFEGRANVDKWQDNEGNNRQAISFNGTISKLGILAMVDKKANGQSNDRKSSKNDDSDRFRGDRYGDRD